jgi:hypothetical protein
MIAIGRRPHVLRRIKDQVQHRIVTLYLPV